MRKYTCLLGLCLLLWAPAALAGDGDDGLLWGGTGNTDRMVMEKDPGFSAYGDGDDGLLWGSAAPHDPGQIFAPISMITRLAAQFGMAFSLIQT